jgi:hypothetical protein
MWLERLRPLFVSVAIGSLGYQAWVILSRPPALRTRPAKAMLAASVISNVVVLGLLVFVEIRYQ